MIPQIEDLKLDEQQRTSRDYRLQPEKSAVFGYTENIEAVKQAVLKALNTERYRNIIYSWDYGVELADLIGEPISYVIPELERRITECLLMDERITAVDSFEFEIISKKAVLAKFRVETIFGDFKAEREVEV